MHARVYVGETRGGLRYWHGELIGTLDAQLMVGDELDIVLEDGRRGRALQNHLAVHSGGTPRATFEGATGLTL